MFAGSIPRLPKRLSRGVARRVMSRLDRSTARIQGSLPLLEAMLAKVDLMLSPYAELARVARPRRNRQLVGFANAINLRHWPRRPGIMRGGGRESLRACMQVLLSRIARGRGHDG